MGLYMSSNLQGGRERAEADQIPILPYIMHVKTTDITWISLK